MSMHKMLLLVFSLIFPLTYAVHGQVTGHVYDFEQKKIPLEYVVVKNITSGQLAQTKADGQFTIAAKKGDLLSFTKTGYHIDTLYLIDLSAKRIFLPVAANELKEVGIVGVKINPSIFTPDPEAKPFRRLETDNLRGKKNFDRAGGLKFNLGYGKYKRNELKEELLAERSAVDDEINSTFTAEFVTGLVKLNGRELKDFMTMYRPSTTLVESERPFNYKLYTVKAYHAWLKLPPEQRKPQVFPKL
ncbi:MAG: hypothetical protein EOO92_04425 [Pedobacter sp.]|nr:MAG: hypothetical protein EOO92_04425 [Pedobacter sp.]